MERRLCIRVLPRVGRVGRGRQSKVHGGSGTKNELSAPNSVVRFVDQDPVVSPVPSINMRFLGCVIRVGMTRDRTRGREEAAGHEDARETMEGGATHERQRNRGSEEVSSTGRDA